MATQADVKQTIDRDLHPLSRELEDLPGLADERDDAQESVRYDAELTWYGVMVGLAARLAPAYRAGRMTPEQAERYRALLGRPKAALPISERLGFARPTVALEP